MRWSWKYNVLVECGVRAKNQIPIPCILIIRMIITSADVLHSWAVPSLGELHTSCRRTRDCRLARLPRPMSCAISTLASAASSPSLSCTPQSPQHHQCQVFGHQQTAAKNTNIETGDSPHAAALHVCDLGGTVFFTPCTKEIGQGNTHTPLWYTSRPACEARL